MYFYEQQDVDQFMSLYPKSTKESQQSKVTYCINSVKYCPNMLMPCCMGQLLLQLAMQFLVQWIGKIESHAFCEESTISMLYTYIVLYSMLSIYSFFCDFSNWWYLVKFQLFAIWRNILLYVLGILSKSAVSSQPWSNMRYASKSKLTVSNLVISS